MPRKWIPSVVALCCAFAPLQAAAQQQTSYERGVEQRLAGNNEEAVASLREWLAEHPQDADARVNLGYALLALDRFAQAEAEFRAALAIAPDYADASQGLALISTRREARRAFVLVEGALSELDGALPDWREAAATLVAPVGANDTIELRAAWYERFGLEDTEAALLYTRRIDADTWLRIGAGGAPSADFRPKTAFTIGADHRVGRGANATVFGGDIHWRRFPAQDVWTVSPSLTQYLGSEGTFSITARANGVIAQGDNLRLGGLLRGDYAPAPKTRAFIGASAGPDTDLGIVTDTYAVFTGGEVPLGGPLSLTGSLAREWRDGPADRTDFRLGLKFEL